MFAGGWVVLAIGIVDYFTPVPPPSSGTCVMCGPEWGILFAILGVGLIIAGALSRAPEPPATTPAQPAAPAAPAQKVCPSCGAENLPTVKYCGQCGAPL